MMQYIMWTNFDFFYLILMCRFVRDDAWNEDSSNLIGYHDLGLDELDQVIEEAVPQWLGIRE